jgi:hypothetical protein
MTIKTQKAYVLKDRIETVEVEETLPPDVRAQQIWLYNRQPGRWRERKEINLSGTIEHQISALSQEERMARLMELQRKAGLLIEGEATEIASPGEDEDPA